MIGPSNVSDSIKRHYTGAKDYELKHFIVDLRWP